MIRINAPPFGEPLAELPPAGSNGEREANELLSLAALPAVGKIGNRTVDFGPIADAWTASFSDTSTR